METSAKTGFNVEEVFSTVAKELYFQVKREFEQQLLAEANPSHHVPPKDTAPTGKKLKAEAKGAKKEKKKGGCC